ncbi:Putative anti-sigma factor [hydrothermal vent metagenome]|uniref:Anti-sigma factor n=1 Tax=hydrothermal vent metagenome TaxID=652676 RepID=A0A3B0U1H8_9ZZZZ
MENKIDHLDIILSKVLSGNASKEEIKALEDWKKSSDKNLKLFQKSLKLWQANHFFIAQGQIDSDFNAINARIIRTLSIHNKRRDFFISMYKAAAILLIPVLIIFSWYYIKDLNKPIQYTEISAPKGQISKCVLADGTEVWLNSGTSIKYSNRFNKKYRDIYLDGEAYFKVKRNQSKPFRVQANTIKVRVHGTSFNVAAYKDLNTIETILEKGSVEIILNRRTRQTIFLKPGERAVYDIQKQRVNIDKVDVQLHTAWRKGKFLFKDADLFMIFKELERIYDVSIQLEDPSIGSIRMRGMFEYNHNIVDALCKIEKTTNLKYQIQGRVVHIRYKK